MRRFITFSTGSKSASAEETTTTSKTTGSFRRIAPRFKSSLKTSLVQENSTSAKSPPSTSPSKKSSGSRTPEKRTTIEDAVASNIIVTAEQPKAPPVESYVESRDDEPVQPLDREASACGKEDHHPPMLDKVPSVFSHHYSIESSPSAVTNMAVRADDDMSVCTFATAATAATTTSRWGW